MVMSKSRLNIGRFGFWVLGFGFACGVAAEAQAEEHPERSGGGHSAQRWGLKLNFGEWSQMTHALIR